MRQIWLGTVIAAVMLGVQPVAAATPGIGSVVPRSSLPAPSEIAPGTVPLQASGGPLFFSDAPEQFNVDSGPGAFYRDTFTGAFRAFWHHQNVGTQPASVALTITNTSKSTELLLSHGLGMAQNFYPDQAGQAALAAFYRTDGGYRVLARLAPGQSAWLVEPAGLTAYAGKMYGNTVSGMGDFVAVTLGTSGPSTPSAGQLVPGLPSGARPAPVVVTNLAYAGNAPVDPLTVPVLAREGNTVRGTFAHWRRAGVVAVNLAAGPQDLAIESAVSGIYSRALPGEYAAGYDAVDQTTVYDNGNYGVTYHLTLNIQNPGNRYRSVAVYDIPAGGAGHYVVDLHHQILTSPYLTYQDAWEIADQSVGERGRIILNTALPGGSDGPQDLVIVPSTAAVP